MPSARTVESRKHLALTALLLSASCSPFAGAFSTSLYRRNFDKLDVSCKCPMLTAADADVCSSRSCYMDGCRFMPNCCWHQVLACCAMPRIDRQVCLATSWSCVSLGCCILHVHVTSGCWCLKSTSTKYHGTKQ